LAKISDLTERDCEQGDVLVVRVFINGQYMATCKMVDVLGRIDNDFVLDADLEIFEMEKK